MIRVFVGYDERESVVFHAFNQSVLDNTSVPVSITPVHGDMILGFKGDRGQRDGTNRFVYTRYLIPALTGYEGWAIFVDGDMIALGDLQELWDLRDPSKAVLVVKHDYQTSSPRKYVGTPMENDNVDYPRKNWSSVVLWNCGHPANLKLTKDFVSQAGGEVLHRFQWLEDCQIGDLPIEWNMLVDEVMCEAPKLVHYTLGCPGIEGYQYVPYSQAWHDTLLRVNKLSGQKPEEMIERAYGDRGPSYGSWQGEAAAPEDGKASRDRP